jgi:hypothetical protein
MFDGNAIWFLITTTGAEAQRQNGSIPPRHQPEKSDLQDDLITATIKRSEAPKILPAPRLRLRSRGSKMYF